MEGHARELILAGALLLSVSALSQARAQGTPAAASAPATSESTQRLEEVDVVGERPGPKLWKVTRGGHVLWVLGTLATYSLHRSFNHSART